MTNIVFWNVCLFSESVDQVVEKYGLQKSTLLREISIKTGIQVTPMESVVTTSSPLYQMANLVHLIYIIFFICLVDSDKGVQLWQSPQACLHRGGHPEYFPCCEARQPQSLRRLPLLPEWTGQSTARWDVLIAPDAVRHVNLQTWVKHWPPDCSSCGALCLLMTDYVGEWEI